MEMKQLYIENNQACFLQLWQKLEQTRRLFGEQYKRYCIRRICQRWMPGVTDDFLFEVCSLCGQAGYDELPLPALHPYPHREFLRALVAVTLGIGMRQVDLKALDAAYSEAFPRSTPLNVQKRIHRYSHPFPQGFPQGYQQTVDKHRGNALKE